jgi:hypothetical protein
MDDDGHKTLVARQALRLGPSSRAKYDSAHGERLGLKSAIIRRGCGFLN